MAVETLSIWDTLQEPRAWHAITSFTNSFTASDFTTSTIDQIETTLSKYMKKIWKVDFDLLQICYTESIIIIIVAEILWAYMQVLMQKYNRLLLDLQVHLHKVHCKFLNYSMIQYYKIKYIKFMIIENLVLAAINCSNFCNFKFKKNHLIAKEGIIRFRTISILYIFNELPHPIFSPI